MTSTTTPTAQTTDPLNQTHPTGKDHTMRPDPLRTIRTALTATAAFLGLLLLVALWTVYGPSYDAQAAPLAPAPTDASSTASEPCPAGEATGGTCGSEGALPSPDAPTSTDSPSQATEAPARRCKGCRLTQEEYDARQADKQAAHDRAEARRQRGAERRADAQRKREERAARKTSKSSTSSKSSRSHASKASESSSDGLAASDGTATPEDTPSPSEVAESASSGDTASDSGSTESDTDASDDSPTASAPYTPLEIPEASRRPAPYDASKDPFEVRREAARQAADAVNHSADQVKAPSASSPSPPPPPTSTHSSGYWAEQLPTWSLGLIGFLAAAGLIVYKASRPRGDRRS